MAEGLPELFTQSRMPSAEELSHAVVQVKKVQKHQADPRLQSYYDRLQRAASWLAKARKISRDPEATFMFSWVALNALSAVRAEVFETQWWKEEGRARPKFVEQQNGQNDRLVLEWFLWRASGLDVDCKLLRGVIEDRWNDVQTIIQTKYLLPAYWKWSAKDLKHVLERDEKTVKAAIGLEGNQKMIYCALCQIIIWRLRTLRNQIFHGCATDLHSRRRSAGESELEVGARLLIELLWAFLMLMASDVGQVCYWPPVPYPRDGSLQHQPFNASWLPTEKRLDR